MTKVEPGSDGVGQGREKDVDPGPRASRLFAVLFGTDPDESTSEQATIDVYFTQSRAGWTARPPSRSREAGREADLSRDSSARQRKQPSHTRLPRVHGLPMHTNSLIIEANAKIHGTRNFAAEMTESLAWKFCFRRAVEIFRDLMLHADKGACFGFKIVDIEVWLAWHVSTSFESLRHRPHLQRLWQPRRLNYPPTYAHATFCIAFSPFNSTRRSSLAIEPLTVPFLLSACILQTFSRRSDRNSGRDWRNSRKLKQLLIPRDRWAGLFGSVSGARDLGS